MFPAAVEIWRPLVSKYAGDIPVPFLLAWIQKESYGNPCSYTSLHEFGIFQLMRGSNLQHGGTTEAALRAACMPVPSQALARSLTSPEADAQVRSGVQYVNWARNYARTRMREHGVTWPESSKDFGRLTMFVHALPARIAPWFAAARAGLGRPPRSWAELVPFAPAANISDKWVKHADWIGSHWGGMPIPVLPIAVAAGAGVLYYLWRSRR